ncbi:MAG: protein kinase [Methanomicrobiaceae archaeon]|nr:protein kinase [Methanomicrobiaceae archaeon]
MKFVGRGTAGNSGRRVGACLYPALVICFLLTIIILYPVSAAPEPGGVDNGTVSQTVTKSIAAAITGAKPGSVLLIETGEWDGNFVINKPLSLIGVDTGNGKPHIVTEEGLSGIRIASDDVTLDGFIISGASDCAIWIEGNRTTISKNMILGTPFAISIISGEDILVSENSILNHSIGIYAERGVSGTITLNNFDNPVNAKSITTALNWSSANSSYLYEEGIYNSSLGNFWNDYKGNDEYGDGVGSGAYIPYISASDIRNVIDSDLIGLLSGDGKREFTEGYWTGLYKDANYVKDKYPLVSENSNYVIIPEISKGEIPGSDNNGTPLMNVLPVSQIPGKIPDNLTMPGGEDNGTPPLIPETGGTVTTKTAPMFYLQHPFEIVFVMVLIAGVFSGLIGIMGRYGRIYSLRGNKKNEVRFLAVAFGSMSVVMLYTVTSYTSRLIYRFVDYGLIQVAFIFITAYLISSSGFLAFGLIRGSFPVTLYRLHCPVAIMATVLFAVSIYNAPVELGPVTGMAYPASLLLSIALPLVFRRRFRSMLHRWDAENGDKTASSFDPDSTSLFMKEEDIMSSSLSSSYFPESLHDKYSDVEFIGKGGIARVFKAKRRKDGVVVAVKVPINFDETTGRVFLKEMRIWEGLEHPNIAKLNSVNIFPVPYVEMEFLDAPLSSLEKPLSPGEAVKIIYEVAEGLEYAHSRGIIHRDIKPQNIMLTVDRTAKITDWGLGKIMSDGNETTVVGFSLNYAAPEQVAPRTFGHPDERTDIYQLGIVFYELITGKKPFTGAGVGEMTDDILHKLPVPPSEAGAEDDIFDNLVMKCLKKNQNERFSSVGEFKLALRNIIFQMKSLNDFFTALNHQVK